MNTEKQIPKISHSDKNSFNVSDKSVNSNKIIYYRGKSYFETSIEKITDMKFFTESKDQFSFREFYY